MFSLLQNILGSQKLLISGLYNEKAFYWAFLRDLKSAKRNVVIESPYLTERKARYFMPILKELHRRKIKVRINTRNPNFHDLYMKNQAEKALTILRTGQAEIYVCTDLRHWKLAAIDKSILWEGSLNILSHAKNKEIMRRTQSPYLCRQMLRFIKINS